MTRNQEIKTLYKQGKTYQEIGDKYGITRQRIHQIVKNIKTHNKKENIYLRERLGLINRNFNSLEDYFEYWAQENEFKNPVFEILNWLNISQITDIKEGSRDRFRELVRIRDNHTCQLCGRRWKKGERRFDTHHIYSKGNSKNDWGNHTKVITLCHRCHLNIK